MTIHATHPSWIVRIPTPLWLIGLVIAALAAGSQFALPAVVRHVPTGVVLIAAGGALAAWARLAFKRDGAEIFPWSQTHSVLVIHGPFRYSRNPMYLGLLIVAVGAALVTGTWLMWGVPVVLFVLDHFVIIPFEERSMEHTFPEAFRAYRKRVRRWL